MKVIKNIIIFILEIILTVSIVGLITINLLSNTIFSKEYALAKLDETNYYSNIYNYIQSNFEKYTQQSGLESSVFENVITEDLIKEDTLKIINNIYESDDSEITTEALEENLKANIKSQIGDNQVLKDDALDDFTKTIAKEYKTSISKYKVFDEIGSKFTKIKMLLSVVQVIVITVLVADIILILVINLKTIIKFLSGMGISILSSGILFEVIKLYISKKINIQNISILNEYISETVKNIINEIMAVFGNYATYLIILGIIVVIISSLIESKKKQKND